MRLNEKFAIFFSFLSPCLLLSKFAVCLQLTLFVPVFFMRNVVILKSIDEDNNWVGLVFTLFFYVQYRVNNKVWTLKIYFRALSNLSQTFLVTL